MSSSECNHGNGEVGGDVKITVEGKTIVCPKDVLIAGSEYFRAMFSCEMIESRSNEVTLKDQKAEFVSAVIDCIQTGELAIGDDVQELTEVAVMLQVPAAIESCTAYLKQALWHTNCLGIMSFADRLALNGLYNMARRHMMYFFTQVYPNPEFLALHCLELTAYLNDKHLNCESEASVVDAIDVWYRHDVEGRADDLATVLQSVHIEALHEGEWEDIVGVTVLADTVPGQQWVKDNEKTKDLRHHKPYRCIPVCFLTFGGVILDLGQWRRSKDIYKLGDGEKRFTVFKSLAEIYPHMGDDMGFQVTVSGKDVYFTGGQPDLTKQNYEMNVWRLDGFSMKWDVVTQLPSPRRDHATCASTTCLYLLGGLGLNKVKLDTFQQYDIVNDKWTDLPALTAMPSLMYSFVALYHRKKVYVYEDRISYYDLDTGQWTVIANTCTNTFTNYRFPASFHRYIYEFLVLCLSCTDDGTRMDDAEYLTSVITRYDTVTGKSDEIPISDTKLNFGEAVVIVNGKFYTIAMFEDNKLVCGTVGDFSRYSVVSENSLPPNDALMVALPDYPAYRKV